MTNNPDAKVIRNWHRMLGIVLTDLFTGTPWRVELEKELSVKSQLLDLAIISRTGEDPTDGIETEEWPDGLTDLKAHNLVTYKSQHEALTGWVLDELIGHYVNYRKLLGEQDDLPSETDFGLFAVCARFPRDLARAWRLIGTGWPGVFDIAWGSRHIRVVVLGAVAQAPRNAVWELFSADTDRLRHGNRHYRFRSAAAASLMHHLYRAYQLEVPRMPYNIQEFLEETQREFIDYIANRPEQRRRVIDRAPVEERLQGVPVEQRLQGVNPADVIKHLGPEEVIKYLDPQILDKLKQST